MKQELKYLEDDNKKKADANQWNPSSQIEEIFPELVGIRRQLHSCPELGTREHQTAAIIRGCLDSFGITYEYPVADTGIVATLRGTGGGEGRTGNTVALRADMDALPLTEPPHRPYSSKIPGVMHACGHDAHMTIALGTARLLSQNRDKWSGCVKFFFQPAEETIGGAQRMIAAGCMENPHVDYVTGLHVMSYYDAGHIELKHKKLNAASDEIHITVKGTGCHGAYPDNGVDAIVIAASLITSLQSIISRSISPLNNAVLTLGTIQGGTAGNIVADKVTMTGTLRTTDPETRQKAARLIKQQTAAICQAFGGEGEAEIISGYSALINDDEIVDLLLATAEPILGREKIHWKEFPSLGVEDFSFFLEKTPGVFYHLGCGNEEKGITAPIHSCQFDIDENCLKTGVRLQTELTLNLLRHTKPMQN